MSVLVQPGLADRLWRNYFTIVMRDFLVMHIQNTGCLTNKSCPFAWFFDNSIIGGIKTTKSGILIRGNVIILIY